MVFVTKYRQGVLDADMLRCCEDAMRKVCGDFGAELREFNGEDDNVHLLVAYPPKVVVSGLVNSLKGVSARRLRSEFTGSVSRHIRCLCATRHGTGATCRERSHVPQSRDPRQTFFHSR